MRSSCCGRILGANSRQRSSDSIITSTTGDIQVYSAASKDRLELIDPISFEPPHLAPFDYQRFRSAITQVANIRETWPMAIGGAAVPAPSTMDLALEELRQRTRSPMSANATGSTKLEDSAKKVRRIISMLRPSASTRGAAESQTAITHALSDEFGKTSSVRPLTASSFWRTALRRLSAMHT